MKSAGVSPVIQDGNVLLKLRVKGEGVIAGLEIEQCTYKFLWVYQTLPAPKKNHASHSNTVILLYGTHDGQNFQANSTSL